ncbi:YbaN family protein [Kushneria phosphatilytica]|uniref:Inner membrane protein n=1 Tax=Kushneria phosphatilytica TaxID=657387 RepID=A0A1S1NYT0_9GAMM|nr:YbaN family protein [Kushneria phosphatilytica]OHV12892.1 hypothetical protein BH688_02440 [Kushneria phosphatilytica]QEL10751.1 DUF454 domain-containing protein [Kushneria phosphatilytica]
MIWIGLAVLCFTIGVLGIFLPLLPATDFMLLAAICASRGSRRVEQWIRRNRLSGPLIAAWENERAIATPAKMLSLTMMAVSLWVVWLHVGLAWPFWLVLAILLVVGSYVASRPRPSQRY